MNVAQQLYRRLSPVTLALGSGLTSALGLVLAAQAQGFTAFALGYGVLFGPGAGVLFIVSQQAVNQAVVQRRGLANGYVVSLYPMGVMLGAVVPVVVFQLAWPIVVVARMPLDFAARSSERNLYRAIGSTLRSDAPVSVYRGQAAS